MPSSVSFYESKITEYGEKIRALKKKILIISGFRLLSFILLAICVYLLTSHQSGLLVTLTVVFAAGFIILIRIFFTLSSRKKLAEKLLYINKNELSVISNGSNGFPDGTAVKGYSIYKDDLDIFGHRSVFHLLNRTTTSHGEQDLSSLLNKPLTDTRDIRNHQAAIAQLSKQAVLRQMITAQGLLHDEKEGNLDDLSNWIETPLKLSGKSWLNILRFVLPVFNVAALFFYLSTDNPGPLGAGIVISWIFTGSFAKYILTQHTLTGKKQSILGQYGAILKHFGQADSGDSTLLEQLKNESGTAYRAMLKLSQLTGLFDQRLNLLIYVILNSIFMYDIQCVIALENWKKKNKPHFRNWINCVGNIETLNSLATLSFNNPGWSFPSISEGRPMISAVQMAHPLIQGMATVANDISAGKNDQLLLVTGSNMSGKSTFLRTIGTNLLLAQCGAPVCAQSFVFTPMHILSSIRITDSLQDNTSYFMAELKRLHDIISRLENGEPALVLIDEVLRGTNSDDKTHGSEAFIKKLLKYNCLSLFATHDLSLSELEIKYPGTISNYCFESTILNGELLFDYKLHHGVAKNKNASFLMEKMGII